MAAVTSQSHRRRRAAMLIACTAVLVHVCTADVTIRGVPRSKQSLYANGINCVLRDADSASADPVYIPINRINDNYCDCADGSDEPGTASSCENGRFYCVNAGYKGMYIPSAHVGDGACDCCDGSDEAAGLCEDACAAQRESAMEAAQADAKAIMSGVAAREKMIAEGKRLVLEDQRELDSLKARLSGIGSKITAAEQRVEILRSLRDDVERIQVPSGNMPPPPSYNGGNAVDDDELSGDDSDFDIGSEDLDIPADGEGISDDVVPADEPDTLPAPTSDTSEDAIETTNKSNANDVLATAREDSLCAELAKSSADNRMLAYFQYYRALGTAKLRRLLPQKVYCLIGDGGGKPGAAMCLDKAEKASQELRSEKSEIEGQITALEAKLTAAVIADHALRSLHGKCVKQTFTQYEFELCLFDRVQQYEHGNVIAQLGSWGSWKPETAPHREMLYSDGDQCWNGPKRSTTVRIECGDVNEILSVDEPNRCMYEMRFKTPAVCEAAQGDAVLNFVATDSAADDVKDEL
jgi:protein kinase C substrate 80K-H